MKPLGFWRWFFRGTNHSRPGFAELFWGFSTLFCLLTALSLAYLARYEQVDILAKNALFPLVGIFIGVSFTGASFALSNLRSEEIMELIYRGKKGFEYYVFGIQTAALWLLISVGFCTISTMNIFYCASDEIKHLSRFLVFFLLAMSLMQCWTVIRFSVSLANLQFQYRKISKDGAPDKVQVQKEEKPHINE